MAVQQGKKRSGADSLANPDQKYVTGELYRAALFKVDIAGNILSNNAEGIFLLNPSAWEESKSANWAQHNVPGQSDPIFQWVSSGARTVTFEALVTADMSDQKVIVAEKEQKKAEPKAVIEAVADFAVKLFSVAIPPIPNSPSGEPVKNEVTLDISDRLNYYRSLLYPSYTDPNSKGVPSRLKGSPPLLALYAGNSISKLSYSNKITNKHDVWILTDLRIRITKQLANLAPMEATVNFTLVQYNIRSFDSNRFYKDTK